MLEQGDKINPVLVFKTIPHGAEAPEGAACPTPVTLTYDDLFKGKLVVLIGIPGAFTPVCSSRHIPDFIKELKSLVVLGIHAVYCLDTNDAYTNEAWRKELFKGAKVGSELEKVFTLLSDGNGAFIKEHDIEIDLRHKSMGVRSQRFASLVKDGVVRYVGTDGEGVEVKSSSVEAIKNWLQKHGKDL